MAHLVLMGNHSAAKDAVPFWRVCTVKNLLSSSRHLASTNPLPMRLRTLQRLPLLGSMLVALVAGSASCTNEQPADAFNEGNVASAEQPLLVLEEVKKYTSGESINSGTGFGLKLVGTTDMLIVGSPFYHGLYQGPVGAANSLVKNGNTWSKKWFFLDPLSNFSQLGTSLAIEGDTLFLGAPGGDGTGYVSVFSQSGDMWTRTLWLEASDGESTDQFGSAVAISGGSAIIGALGADKDPAVSDNVGAAYIFTQNGTDWTEEAILFPSDGTLNAGFGSAVAIQGNTALVGAPNAKNELGKVTGAVYVFLRSGGIWTEQAKLLPSGTSFGGFGSSIVLSGETVYVGFWDGIHIFSRNGDVFTETGTVMPSEQVAGGFGKSLTVSGDKMLVGATYDDTNGTGSGAAYFFVRVGDVWTEKAKLLPSDGGAYDQFGMAVAFAGDSLFVGQSDKDWNIGAVYEFVLPSANGVACSTGQTCESGFCVDGVCCDAACGGGDGTDCQACSVNMGAATNGVCAPIAAGSTCRAATFDCDAAEVCDGSSMACPADMVSSDGSVCAGGACQAGVCEMDTGTGGTGGGSSGETGGAADNGGDDAEGCSCRVAGERSGQTGPITALAMGFVAAVARRRAKQSA